MNKCKPMVDLVSCVKPTNKNVNLRNVLASERIESEMGLFYT